MVSSGRSQVKAETSPVGRGTVLAPQSLRVADVVEDTFGFAEMQVVAFEDLYGGKLHAALDRQHPRDFYDVKLLYAKEGLTDSLFRGLDRKRTRLNSRHKCATRMPSSD